MRAWLPIASLSLAACGSRTPLDLPASSPPDAALPDAAIPASTCAATVAGAPVTVSSVPLRATGSGTALAVDATSVYWIDDDGVLSAPLGGGTATLLTMTSVASPSLAVQDGVVYFGADDGASIQSVPTSGGVASTVVQGAEVMRALAVQDGRLFWLGMPDRYYGSLALAAAPVAGGTPTSLAGDAEGLAVDATGAYAAVQPPQGDAAIVRWPIAGGPATTLATLAEHDGAEPTPGHVASLALANGNVYGLWLDQVTPPTASLVTVPTTGGAPSTLASLGTGAAGLAVDACHAYVATGASLLRGPLAGGTPTTLYAAAAGETVGPVALDEASVYWAVTTASSSGVMKASPK
jgi:predicted small lipoprotein YifL